MKRFFNSDILLEFVKFVIYVVTSFVGNFYTVFVTDKLLSVFTGEALPMDALIYATLIMSAVTTIVLLFTAMRLFPTYTYLWTTVTYVSLGVLHSVYGMPFTTMQYIFIALAYLIGIAAVIVLPRIKKFYPLFEYMKREKSLRVNECIQLYVICLACVAYMILCHFRKKEVPEKIHTELEEAIHCILHFEPFDLYTNLSEDNNGYKQV